MRRSAAGRHPATVTSLLAASLVFLAALPLLGQEPDCAIAHGSWRSREIDLSAAPGPDLIRDYVVRKAPGNDPDWIYVTNGVSVIGSRDGGCSWSLLHRLADDGRGVLGTDRGILELALYEGRPMAIVGPIVREDRLEPGSMSDDPVSLGITAPSVLVGGVWAEQEWEQFQEGLPPAVSAIRDLRTAGDVAYLLLKEIEEDLPTSGSPGEPDRLMLYRSVDGGRSWEGRGSPGTAFWDNPANPYHDANERRQAFTTLVVDPNDSAHLWFGGTGITRSPDGGLTWQPAFPGANQFDHVTSIDLFHDGNDLQVTLGLDQGSEAVVVRSLTGGDSWSKLLEISDGETLVSSIAHGPGQDDVAVVSTRYSGGNFRSFEGKVHRAAKGVSKVISDDTRASWHDAVRVGGSLMTVAYAPDLGRWTLETIPFGEFTPPVGEPDPGGSGEVENPFENEFSGFDANCLSEQPAPTGWTVGYTEVPKDVGRVYVSNFDTGKVVAFDGFGNPQLAVQVTPYAEGMALDPWGRLVVATRFSGVVARYSPEACRWHMIDSNLPEAEGPSFDPEGNLYIAAAGAGEVWEYPVPQADGVGPRLVHRFPEGTFIEEVRVVPPGGPLAGDLLVLYGEDSNPFRIARLKKTGDDWVRLDDFAPDLRILAGVDFRALGMAVGPDGRVWVVDSGVIDELGTGTGSSTPSRHVDGTAGLIRISPDGSSVENREIAIQPAWYAIKVDVDWKGNGYITTSKAPTPARPWDPEPRQGELVRVDAEGNELLPRFPLMLTVPVGVAVDHFPPPDPPKDDDEDPLEGVDLEEGVPRPPTLPLRAGAGFFGTAHPPPPVPRAPEVVSAPRLEAAASSSSAQQAQSSTVTQAALAPQEQEQPQTALARAAEAVREQEEHAMSARSRRSSPVGAGLAGAALAMGAVGWAMGRSGAQRAYARARRRRRE